MKISDIVTRRLGCDLVDISEVDSVILLTVGYQVKLPRTFTPEDATIQIAEHVLSSSGVVNLTEELQLKIKDLERTVEALKELQKYKDFYDLYKELK